MLWCNNSKVKYTRPKIYPMTHLNSVIVLAHTRQPTGLQSEHSQTPGGVAVRIQLSKAHVVIYSMSKFCVYLIYEILIFPKFYLIWSQGGPTQIDASEAILSSSKAQSTLN